MEKEFNKFLSSLYDMCENNIDSYICTTDGVHEEFERLALLTQDYLDDNPNLTDAQKEQIGEIKNIFDTNTKVCWLENDPKEEFLCICGILDEIDL